MALSKQNMGSLFSSCKAALVRRRLPARSFHFCSFSASVHANSCSHACDVYWKGSAPLSAYISGGTLRHMCLLLTCPHQQHLTGTIKKVVSHCRQEILILHTTLYS